MKRKQTSLTAFLLPSKVQKLSSEPQLLSVQKVHGTHDLVVQPDIIDLINLPSSLTDNQRYTILTKDWPVPDKFPLSKFNNKQRSFQLSWLSAYPGLTYSVKTDGAFCKFCVAFGSCDRGSLVNTPFRDWKDAKSKFNAHFHGVVPKGQTSKNGGRGFEAHMKCKVFSEEFLKKMNCKTNINRELNSALQGRVTKNAEVLESIVKTILLCGRQNLALRGDRDDSKYYKSGKNIGNFQALLDFRVDSGDKVLEEHFSKSAPNATYRSKTIQNEIINIIGQSIQQTIVTDIKKAGGWFSISADEVQDISNKEQLAICLRYADINDVIKERLISFQDVSGDTTGAALAEEILCLLNTIELDPNMIRSQCYDGAGNMMGQIKGVGSRINQRFPKALPFWCSSHLLNRCIVVACEVKEVRNMMGFADKCVRYFNFSTKRQHTLEIVLDQMPDSSKRSKLKELCRTRWVERHDAFEVFVSLYPSIVDALTTILENEKRPDAVCDTSGILHAITTFQFIITLITVYRCLSFIKPLSKSLQGRSHDVVEALREVNVVKDVLLSKRESIDTFHKDIYESAVSLGSKVNIEPSIPRICGRQMNRNNVSASTPEEYYRRLITIPFLDHLIQQFNERFSVLQERATTALLLLPPFNNELTSDNLKYFIDDLPSPDTLQAELDCWKLKFRSITQHVSLSDTLQECNSNMYPNIHTILKIVATFPITSCECERSISRLGLIKTGLRSSMGQDRLTSLCLMSVHRDITIDPKDIVNKFARKNPRKLQLPSILIDSNERDDGELYF